MGRRDSQGTGRAVSRSDARVLRTRHRSPRPDPGPRHRQGRCGGGHDRGRRQGLRRPAGTSSSPLESRSPAISTPRAPSCCSSSATRATSRTRSGSWDPPTRGGSARRPSTRRRKCGALAARAAPVYSAPSPLTRSREAAKETHDRTPHPGRRRPASRDDPDRSRNRGAQRRRRRPRPGRNPEPWRPDRAAPCRR